MSGFNYAKSRATAIGLMRKFGKGSALRGVLKSGPDWEPVTTVVDAPCTVVELQFSTGEIDGTNILLSDRKFLLSVDGLMREPSAKDRLVVGTEELEIIQVWPLVPGDLVLMYTLQARST